MLPNLMNEEQGSQISYSIFTHIHTKLDVTMENQQAFHPPKLNLHLVENEGCWSPQGILCVQILTNSEKKILLWGII